VHPASVVLKNQLRHERHCLAGVLRHVADTGRDVAIGSVYAALDRLEALAQSQALLTGLWDGMELDPERYG